MNGTKKTLPRGYSEIAQFTQNLYNHIIPEQLTQQEDVDAGIASFLDSLFRRRIPVVRFLLEMAMEKQHQERELSAILLLLSKCSAERATKIIEEFILDTQTPDRLKRKLLLVVDAIHATNKISDWVRYFGDKNALAEYALNGLLDAVGLDGDNLNHVFKFLSDQDNDFYQALIANLTYRTDEQSLWLLGMLAEFPNTMIAENAIQALGYRKSPLAYELLDNLITHQEDCNEIRAKAIQRLTQAGILRSSARLMTPHKCFLSWIDGLGNRMLLISRRTGRGRLFMVTFMLHEEVGLQDCTIWDDISTYDMDSLVASLEKQTGLKQIDYSMGIKLVEDSVETILKNKQMVPPNFLIARRVFGMQKLQPQKYQIALNEMGVQYIQKKVPDLLLTSEPLLQEYPFCEWLLEGQEITNFVKVRPSVLSGKMRKETLPQFVKTFIEPKRELWKERFLLTAEFLHRTSPRSYRNQIEICLAIYIHLNNNGNILVVPFMSKLAQMSLQKAAEAYNAMRQGQTKGDNKNANTTTADNAKAEETQEDEAD